MDEIILLKKTMAFFHCYYLFLVVRFILNFLLELYKLLFLYVSYITLLKVFFKIEGSIEGIC